MLTTRLLGPLVPRATQKLRRRRRRASKMSQNVSLFGGPKTRGRGPEHAQPAPIARLRALVGVELWAPDARHFGERFSDAPTSQCAPCSRRLWRPRARLNPPQSEVRALASVRFAAADARNLVNAFARPNFAMRAAFAPPLPAQTRAPACPKMSHFEGGPKTRGRGPEHAQTPPMEGLGPSPAYA